MSRLYMLYMSITTGVAVGIDFYKMLKGINWDRVVLPAKFKVGREVVFE